MQAQVSDQTVNVPPQGTHSIHLITSEIGEHGGPAYNHIVFRDHTGEDKVMMNGLALERQDSELRALRGVMAPPSEGSLAGHHMTQVVEIEIFRGDVKEYLRRMAMAVEALHFINEQNLSYKPEDVNWDSPNSIAHTLVHAMGLEFPEEATHFWAPGHERILLPVNWRSKYEH